jgi:hypothetical protein
MKSKNRLLMVILTAACVSGCDRSRTYAPSSVFTERARLTEITENSVKVGIALEADSAGHPVLRATFTPTQDGLHLYGKDMPEKGVQGYGVPTRLDLVSGALKAAGPVFSDVRAHDLEVADVRLPIYPEGPVTLRLPVEISSDSDLTAQVEISYMACRTGGECKFPVQRKRLELKLPKG